MEALAENSPNVRLRKIDIGRGTPVAAQHGIRSIPHLVLYEGGERVASGTREVLARVNGGL